MKLATALLAMAAAGGCFAHPSRTAAETPAQKDVRMKWWKEARFGLFLHWGLYSVPAGEWDGKTNYAEWILEEAHIPVSTYEKFQPQFNPVNFDAEKWVQMAKAAGMKYVVITTKHHEGFNMFASKYSDYNIKNTPFHRDPLKELAAACKKYGLKMCWYHSIMDWHHPDYLPRRSWESRPVDGADFRKYVTYLRNEVTQLLTEYGPIGVMWFDGEWESTWNHEDGQALYDLCRKLQPNVIVNNRVDVGRGSGGETIPGDLAGDYGTPEQTIPATGIPGYWETCMTMNDHWGYNKTDLDYKSPRDLIQKLVDIASKGGNFLLNIGPTSKGDFPLLAQDRLKKLGDWMHTNSDAIYSTDASPFSHLDWGRCTQKPNGKRTNLYLEVFDWPTNGKLVVPGIGNQPIKAYMLADKTQSLKTVRNGGDIVIDVPAAGPNPDCSVVTLEIAGKPVIYEAPTISAVTDLIVQPVMATLAVNSPSLTIRYTADGSVPSASSKVYSGPVEITDTSDLKAQTFVGDKAVSSVTTHHFDKATPLAASTVQISGQGLNLSVYNGAWEKLPDFDGLQAVELGQLDHVGIERWPKRENFGIVATGYVNVPETAVYQFDLSSDDGSDLFIDHQKVVDNDGTHSEGAKSGSVALEKGIHLIKLEYFNAAGGSGLSLKWAKAGMTPMPIPDSALQH